MPTESLWRQAQEIILDLRELMRFRSQIKTFYLIVDKKLAAGATGSAFQRLSIGTS
jgi:hypothetical protein